MNLKAKELRQQSLSDLELMLEESYKELFSLRCLTSQERQEKTHLFVIKKRDIARIKTIIRELKG